MKRQIIRVLSALIPYRNWRHRIRNRFLKGVKSENRLNIYSGQVVLFDDTGREVKFNPGKYSRIQGIVNASNTVIKIHESCTDLDLNLEVTSPYSEVIIHKNVSGRMRVRLSYGVGQKLHVGANTKCVGVSFILDENAQIFIGENNLISAHVVIFGADGHAVIDRETEKVINGVKHPLIIGNHCWIGYRAMILKNAYIPNNCIVGGGTVVTGQFNEENIVLGGNPARIVKRNVDWTHKNAYFLVNQKEIK